MSTAPASHTAPAPTSAEEAPAALDPIQNWGFPFAAENADAALFFSALAQAASGFYPLGANGLWHGGVHFDNGTGAVLKQDDGLRAIADGEVVAYRLNDTYPLLEYPDIEGTQSRKAMYSSGFVLMHHRLALPPDPKATDASREPPADEVLDFYTLVMHVACWKKYQAEPTMKRPRFWKSKYTFRIGNKDQQAPSPKDETLPRQRGANVRQAPVAGKKKGHYTSGAKIGLLPQYSRVVIGAHRGPWGEITDIMSGSLLPVEAGDVTPPAPNGSIGWIYLPEQESIIEPDPLDTVVILDPPIQLKAGELLGHMGEYQRYQDSTPLPPIPHRPLLHMECFAGPSFPAFLDKSRERAKQLPDAQKTLLVIPKGTKLVVGAADVDTRVASGLALKPIDKNDGKSLWVKVQPHTVSAPTGKNTNETLTPSGSAVWVARASLGNRGGCEAWSTFPLQGGKDGGVTIAERILSKTVLDKRGHAIDDTGQVWHEVDVLTENGGVTGWVSESVAHWESPFAWPGFELIDASDISVKDAYERQLLQAKTLLPGEKEAFQPAAEVVGGSALMAALDKVMDRNKDYMLDTQELGQAMATPSLAQGLSRIIGRYESEWGGDMERWQSLTDLMKAGEPIWKKELERIEKLRWWSEVGSIKNFPSDAKVYHFHPIGLIENFVCGCNCVNIDQLLSEYEHQHVDFEPGTLPLDETSKENLKNLLYGLLDYYKNNNKDCNIYHIAYILATARLETKKYNREKKLMVYFEPVTEAGSLDYFNKYDPVLADTEYHKKRAIQNGNTSQGDGYKYRGRGYVQITWKNNYEKLSRALNIDIVNQPDRALDPKIAAATAIYGMETGLFTGKKLSDYISESHQDYYNARKIINGLDRASDIEGFAKKFLKILENSRC